MARLIDTACAAAVDPRLPFVELEAGDPPATVAETEAGWTVEILLPGIAVDDLVVEVAVPLLLVRRHDDPDAERRFVLLAQVDPASLRATLDGDTLKLEARRTWSPPHRLPVRSDFLWEGRVAHRPGEPLPPRPHHHRDR